MIPAVSLFPRAVERKVSIESAGKSQGKIGFIPDEPKTGK